MLESVINKWKNHNLRDLDYINFNFEANCHFEPMYLKLPSNDCPEGIINPKYDESKEEEMRSDYYNNSYNNILETLKFLNLTPDENCVVYSNNIICLKPILDNCNVELIDEYISKFECKFDTLIKIIEYTTIPEIYHKYEPEASFPTCKDMDMMDFYFFPRLNMIYYIYDQRGGILVSLDSKSKSELINIFKNVHDNYRNLLNPYWFNNMKTNLYKNELNI